MNYMQKSLLGLDGLAEKFASVFPTDAHVVVTPTQDTLCWSVCEEPVFFPPAPSDCSP